MIELAAEPRPWHRMSCAAGVFDDVVHGQEIAGVVQFARSIASSCRIVLVDSRQARLPDSVLRRPPMSASPVLPAARGPIPSARRGSCIAGR